MKKPFTLSIRSILVIGFGGLTMVGIVASLYLGLSTAFHNTQELLSEKSETHVARMVDVINGRLRPVEAQARWIAKHVREGKLPLRTPDDAAIALAFDAVLSATPQVGAAAFISPSGVIRQWLRERGDPPVTNLADSPAVMQWLKDGGNNPKQVWGPPLWLDSLDTAVIIYETPMFDAVGYLGYLVLAVPIADLSLSLAKISKNAFALHGKNNVLAHPLMIDWQPLDKKAIPTPGAIYQGRSALVRLDEIGDPVLERIWSAEYQDLIMLKDMVDTSAVAADIGDRQYVFLYRTIKGYGPAPWYVGTYINMATAGDVVRRLGSAAFAGFWIFIAALVIGFLLARALARPVRSLAKASKAVQDSDFNNIPPMPSSRIKELQSAMSSFESMVAGLAERELIRRTLGRYVPESIAEKLLKDDGGLSPTEAEATILFADIAGFTALTEALGPTRIVEVLNAYFSRMTEIIEAHGGVITQFQGDAILAIYNVPIEADDHATRACLTAMEMRTAVSEEIFAGQKINSRIGINTGTVVAGAVGAEGRLTYTVHGDAVNRAARVEAMNKETGTSVLITDATARLLSDIAVREVGTMEVRGQTEAVTVFTIGDTKGE